MRAVVKYTYLGFLLNSLLDEGKSLPIDETLKHLEDRTVLEWLSQIYGNEIDLSVYKPEEKADLLEMLNDMTVVNARRKFGVEHNGIALLVAYCFEAIQRTAT